MTKILAAMAMALAVTLAHADAAPEKNTVCVDVKDKDGKTVMDPKTNKPKQNCREVKVHQKLEGNKIPDKK